MNQLYRNSYPGVSSNLDIEIIVDDYGTLKIFDRSCLSDRCFSRASKKPHRVFSSNAHSLTAKKQRSAITEF